jgi:hypothetical protein
MVLAPIEWKLDALCKAGISARLRGAVGLAEVEEAWKEFSPAEQELLGAGRLLAYARLFVSSRRILPKRTRQWYEDCMQRMIDRAQQVRAGLMTGTISRPPHENPSTIRIAVGSD